MKEILTLKEAADLLRVHPSTLRRHARKGRVPGMIKVGRIMRFKRTELEGLA